MDYLFSIVRSLRWGDIFMRGENDFTVRLLESGELVREVASDELDHCREIAETFVQEV